jgi:hypothetical protein
LSRCARIGERIVEFGDGPRAKDADEAPTAARLFRNGHGKERFAMLTDLGAIGYGA